VGLKLARTNIKPWLDEAAVFIGQHGVGPWQNREIIALLKQFDRRGCPVIPVILASAPANPDLPWELEGFHCVDFHAIDSHPLKRLVWGITGEKPAELFDVPFSEKPATMQRAGKSHLLHSKDHHAGAHLKISKTRLYPPLAKPPIKSRRTNSKSIEVEW
jgi:hypothetical protein